ncbi:hypothetical protein K2173_019631 [Erythroxylum novogranatense]|uniref:Transcription factor CBF/NF-Y/archaeal histone domain-containing protein n=1 Tax=Erythroxylum novogranatense TaxID=1862640 RepID=A0AAV8UEL0_9ROSI|nr:hypothetical protein K2173_019631 [Erythroxylum novogranatense]
MFVDAPVAILLFTKVGNCFSTPPPLLGGSDDLFRLRFDVSDALNTNPREKITNGVDKPHCLILVVSYLLSSPASDSFSKPSDSLARFVCVFFFSLTNSPLRVYVAAMATEAPASPESGDHSPRSNSNVREQDRYLPIANISRIMKKGLPANGKIAKDAKETVQECVSEFISFITSEASDKCQREKRKTINGDDLLWAMATLGFEDYIDPLKVYLSRYREMEGDAKGSAKNGDSSNKRDAMPSSNVQISHQGSFC